MARSRGRRLFHLCHPAKGNRFIFIGTAKRLERLNASIDGSMGGVNMAFNIPQHQKMMLITEHLEYRSSMSNPRSQQQALYCTLLRLHRMP